MNSTIANSYNSYYAQKYENSGRRNAANNDVVPVPIPTLEQSKAQIKADYAAFQEEMDRGDWTQAVYALEGMLLSYKNMVAFHPNETATLENVKEFLSQTIDELTSYGISQDEISGAIDKFANSDDASAQPAFEQWLENQTGKHTDTSVEISFAKLDAQKTEFEDRLNSNDISRAAGSIADMIDIYMNIKSFDKEQAQQALEQIAQEIAKVLPNQSENTMASIKAALSQYINGGGIDQLTTWLNEALNGDTPPTPTPTPSDDITQKVDALITSIQDQQYDSTDILVGLFTDYNNMTATNPTKAEELKQLISTKLASMLPDNPSAATKITEAVNRTFAYVEYFPDATEQCANSLINWIQNKISG